jgi:DNA polymerase IV
MEKSPRTIVLIDMDAFFASVEQRDNPQLRGKPVLIAGTHEQKGVVVTCSYEARKFGCHSGMSVLEARKLCPQGYYVAGNHAKYVYASARIIDICYRFTPLVEPFSVDEMFLDISGSIRLFGSAQAIGENLRAAIRRELNLPCSLGIAPNKILAKLGSKLAKPDGLRIIRDAEKLDILRPLPVQEIFGIGPRTRDKLNKLGIYTVGQLSAFTYEEYCRRFGKFGAYLWLISQGEDDTPVIAVENAERPKSISNETTLYEATANRFFLKKVLLSQVHKVCFRLRRHGAKARTVHIVVRTEDFDSHRFNRTVTTEVFFDTEIYQIAVELFDEIQFEPHEVRLIGVGVSNLVYDQDPDQLWAFPRYDEKRVHAAEAVDSIKRKYGEGMIRIGDVRTPNYEYRPDSKPPLSFGMKATIKSEMELTRSLQSAPEDPF